MASSSRGLCPAPFYQENLFPSSGGFIDGRFCQPLGQLTCCLPCPASDWTYSDDFVDKSNAANWLNVAALIATSLLLLSFTVLHSKWTHFHYLSICLVIAVAFLELAFIVPLVSEPDQCFNTITPNDMGTSTSCALSGAFILFGGWGIVMWVFWRALSLHLQICWEVVPGKIFFYASLVLGWGVPAVGVALALTLTGVSFRFGNVCHINHKNGLQDFWGPILAFSAAALIIQFVTLGYCIQVYIRSLMDGDPATEGSSALPSYTGSVGGTRGRRHAFRRVKQVIRLQWRGVTVVLVIITEIIFFAVVFMRMDRSTTAQRAGSEGMKPWLRCLLLSRGDKNQCLKFAAEVVEKEDTILAVLVFLSLSGFWLLLLLGRWSMILGWRSLIKGWFRPANDCPFSSADGPLTDPDHYTVLGYGKSNENAAKSPDVALTRVSSPSRGVGSPDPDSKKDYFGREAKYRSPDASFSAPRAASANGVRGQDQPIPVSPIEHLEVVDEKKTTA